MSALAGRWNFTDRPDAGDSCRKMLAAQEIHGPDHGCSWDGGAVALGRRLFRVLPEDVHDREVQSGGGGRYRLVADVRLDNRDELASALAIDPARAAVLPDAAFLLAAWERWEEACFARLFGDYAFALWDDRDRRLVLARDHLGNRPLHYHRGKDFIAFASMPKGLHALPDVPYAPDQARVAELLALMPEYGSRSFFEDVSRVETGHMVVVAPDRVVARRHWDPQPAASKPTGDDYIEGVRHLFDAAVEARLRGAGNRVGSHLSAGLDSSAVAATAARLMAGRGGKVLAFTSVPREGYDGPQPDGTIGDEGALAAATAALYPNMEHVLVRPGNDTVLDGLDREFLLCERPLLNLCNHRWINAINAQARRSGLSVLLVGTMGNMTTSYNGLELMHELAAQGRWARLFREARALAKTGEMRWRGSLANAIGPWIPERLWLAFNRFRGRSDWDIRRYTALNPKRSAELGLRAIARDRGLDLAYRPRKNGFETRLWVLRRIDTANFRKGWLAGAGIDVRDPTTDRRLVEFSLSLPMEAFLAAGRPRALARRAFTDRLPASVLGERRRGLQAIDWHEGMTAARDRLHEELERLEQVPAAATALDLARMRALIKDWPTGDWNSPGTRASYRLALLRGYASGHFLRKASRSNA